MDGTYPLVIRIYNGKRFSSINLKTYLKENHFDDSKQRVKRNHPNEKILNMRIEQTIMQLQETKLKLELRDEIISDVKIKNTIVKPINQLGFIPFTQ